MTEIITGISEHTIILNREDFYASYNEIAELLLPEVSEKHANALRAVGETVKHTQGDWVKDHQEVCNQALNMLNLVAYDSGHFIEKSLISMGVLQVIIDRESETPNSTVQIATDADGVVVAQFRSEVQGSGMQAFDLPVIVSDEAYEILADQGALSVSMDWHPAVNPATHAEVRGFVDAMAEAMDEIHAGKYDV